MVKQTTENKQPLLLIIDGDILVYKSCASVEVPINWYGDLWTLHADAAEAIISFEDRMYDIVSDVLLKLNYVGEYKIKVCFSHDINFRKQILYTYKQNREGKRKPICYTAVKEWVIEHYDTVCLPRLEADDVCSILATTPENEGHSVVISGDKDFRSIPGMFYNFLTRTISNTTEAEADMFHLMQTLMGDRADNYSGCPGIGEKKAKQMLEDSATWETVVKAFKKQGLSELDALQQARVAYILRAKDIGDVDCLAEKGIKLWTPETTGNTAKHQKTFL
jgi:DNA polymerase-1